MLLQAVFIKDDRTAFIDVEGNSLSYKALSDFSKLFFSQINKRTLIFIFSENTLGSVSGYVAALETKIVPLLLHTATEKGLRETLVKKYQPEYFWMPESMISEWDGEVIFKAYGYALMKTGLVAPLLSENLSLLLPTSGSTGSPKLVRHSYNNILANARNVGKVFEINSDDRALAMLPMYYTMGLSVITSYLYGGATVLLFNGSLTDAVFWKFLKEQKATILTGVPYTFEILSKLRFTRMDLPDLKIITQGGGKLSPTLFNEFADYATRTGKKFIATYGQTEGTARMAYLPADFAQSKVGSIGKAIPEGRLYLVDESGEEVTQADTPGEMVYSGPNVTLGYAFSGEDLSKNDEREGVLPTGDIAVKDSDGFFYIVGRISRFLKLYGVRVGLDEVEQLIFQAFGVENICTGTDEKMKIYVTNQEMMTAIADFVIQKTGLYHQAFEVLFIPQIPRNDVGKVIYNFE
ncbi:AMP-binding protein [Flavobacterium sp.]|jgi:long-chain acyl-CoA synthetase|uniref:AMP-binding protein n=1 Tax=Flavobacterium sp. TaxID=239 RepID=UPI0037831648